LDDVIGMSKETVHCEEAKKLWL